MKLREASFVRDIGVYFVYIMMHSIKDSVIFTYACTYGKDTSSSIPTMAKG